MTKSELIDALAARSELTKARAALKGEAAADIDDVRSLLVPTLRHRLVLSYRADADGVSVLDILDTVARSVKA